MKKFLMIVACALMSLCMTSIAFAETANETSDNGVKKPAIKGFVQNKFWDNWEIQGGIGPNFLLGTGSKAKNSTFVGAYVGVGKWIHPIFGLRVAVEGGKYNQIQTDTNCQARWSYLQVHPDAMVDLTNWIGGYKPNRIYSAIVYIGAGVGAGALKNSGASGRSFQFVADAGLQNRFRVCDALSIDLQIQYDLAKGAYRPVPAIKEPRFHALATTVGVTYRFNRRTFDRSGATEDEAKAMLETTKKAQAAADKAAADKAAADKALADKAAELEKTKAALDAAKAAAMNVKKKPQAKSAKEAVETDNYNEMLFYSYGYGVLTSYNEKRLDLIAEHIKQSDKAVFRVDGFADPQTGRKAANERLAGKRAKIAYDYLISKGVPAERLEWRNCGTQNCPFGQPKHNRIVVIY